MPEMVTLRTRKLWTCLPGKPRWIVGRRRTSAETRKLFLADQSSHPSSAFRFVPGILGHWQLFHYLFIYLFIYDFCTAQWSFIYNKYAKSTGGRGNYCPVNTEMFSVNITMWSATSWAAWHVISGESRKLFPEGTLDAGMFKATIATRVQRRGNPLAKRFCVQHFQPTGKSGKKS